MTRHLPNSRSFSAILFSMLIAFVVLPGCHKLPGTQSNENNGPGEVEATQYEYREDLTRVVGLTRGEYLWLGHLDSSGNFLPMPDRKPTKAGLFSGTPIYEPLNSLNGKAPPVPVYEFRSGALIKGKFDKDRNFVPEVGSKIISFKDYQYSKDATRIYNLPGRFVEKKSAAPQKPK